MIDIVFLGNGAMMPTPRRWLSSFLMRVDGRIILFDVGEGTQIPWQQSGWGFKRLDTICISHWHADHIAGLPGVLHAVANSGRTEPVTIIGPRGTRSIVLHLREIASELPFDLVAADLTNGQSWSIGPLRATVRAGLHRVPVLIYRFDLPRSPAFLVDHAIDLDVPRELWSELATGANVSIGDVTLAGSDFLGPPRRGLSIGVMTDTRPTESAVEHLKGVDLLVVEGTYGDPDDADNALRNKHMIFLEAATIARSAEVRRMILTHFSPKMENPLEWLGQAQSVFPDAQLAIPGRSFTIAFDRFRDQVQGNEIGLGEASIDTGDALANTSVESDCRIQPRIVSRSEK